MKRFLCLGVVFISAVQVRPSAQNAVMTGIMRGVVTDNSGAVVPGATVVLLAPANGERLTRTTNDDGILLFPHSRWGSMRCRQADGFRPHRIEAVRVEVGQTTTLNLHYQPDAGRQSIVVSGESPLLRTEDSDQSSVISREQLSELPLSGRRFLDFALLEPNVTSDGQSGLISFAGEQGGEDTGYANGNEANSFTVNGVSATSNYFGNARGANACRISLARMPLKNSGLRFHPIVQNRAARRLDS